MLSMLHHISVESRLHRAVRHRGSVELDGGVILDLVCLLDSGATHASYIRKDFLMDNYTHLHTHIRQFKSQVTLADKKTLIDIDQVLRIPVTLKSASG